MPLPKLAVCVLLMRVGLSGCSEHQANNGFERELTSEQRKASIKQLQNEAAWGAVSKP
jgi:hypothetical protein